MKSTAPLHRSWTLAVPAVGVLLVCVPAPVQSASDESVGFTGGADAIALHQESSRVTLGRLLFHDRRLSKNREVSCSTCHVLARFGIDGRQTPVGVGGVHARRNAPSVFNAASHIAQFWDGRALDLQSQAVAAVVSPGEMAMRGEQPVVRVLSRVPGYVQLFQKAFPGDARAVSLKNVGEAIGAFERGLRTDSRWDKFVAGDQSALTASEKQGLRVFRQTGCIVCHAGPQVGGTSFQKVGAVIPWPNQSDQGRVEVTKFAPDRMVFKVPSLQNVAVTAPYFHDGSATNLEVAIRLMGYHQLGIEMADDDIRAIADWLRALTGQPDAVYIAIPQLPPG